MAVLGVGRHLVGRSGGVPVRCDDPALEPHHALVEVTGDGVARIVQLAGRRPIAIDGTPVEGVMTLVGEARVELGRSLLWCRTIEDGQHRQDEPELAHISGQTLVRSPRAAPARITAPLRCPQPPPDRAEPTGGLVPAALGLAGAGLVAAVMRQPMFLLFGALGALVALGSWAAQHLGALRRARGAARQQLVAMAEFDTGLQRQRADFIAHHLAITTTSATARATITLRSSQLWARRRDHTDAYRVSLGSGDLRWQPTFADAPSVDAGWQTLEHAANLAGSNLAVPIDLGRGSRIALRGDSERTHGIARALLVQLAANCGPADLRVVVATARPKAWAWLHGLPHAAGADGSPSVVDESGIAATLTTFEPHDVHVVIVTDQPEWLAARTGHLRRAVMRDNAPALIALLAPGTGVPNMCTGALTLASVAPIGNWVADTHLDALPEPVRVAGLSERSATSLVAELSALVDPEDPLSCASALPRELSLGALLAAHDPARLSPAAIAAGWLAAGSDPSPRTAIGIAADGIVDIDLVRDGPHGLMAGTTGAGKSELLRSLVTGMAVHAAPHHLTFVLIDYKGGSTFDACAALPHVVGLVTDLDDRLADRALRSLHAELRRRESLLREYGAADLGGLRSNAPEVVLPRLVVVIDEFAALVNEQPDFMHALVGVAQRGRSLGVHLLLATQRPSGVISDDIRANTNLRLALRLHDASDAVDVIGDPSPATIPRGMPGRAVMRLGPDEYVTFQTARCTEPAANTGTKGDDASELETIVRAVRDAAALVGTVPPRRPWLPPLGSDLPHEPGSLGVIDDPDRQGTESLVWDRAKGHLLLAGSVGSGLTSALVTLGAEALRSPRPLDLYIVDAVGGSALDVFDTHDRCAGVVRLDERERLMRLLHRLSDEVKCRTAIDPAAPTRPDIVLLVDGLVALRRRVDDLDSIAELEALEHIIARGAAVGVVGAFATDQLSAVPNAVLAHCPQRWAFHFTDPHDAHMLGVRAADVPAAVPGRLVLAACGREAQLTRPPQGLCAQAAHDPVVRIGSLPAVVPSHLLPLALADRDSISLPIGLRFVDSRAALLDVADGDHVMVIGPARSGRSAALRRLVNAWVQALPDGWVGVLSPRRSASEWPHRFESLTDLLSSVPSTGHVLVAIDDADLVDDHNGALAALAASRRAGAMVAAVGRPDTLRQAYGHWTGVVRRSRIGILTAACSDLDGDLVGAVVPRRLPIPHRVGLAWLAGNGAVTLIQVATDEPETSPAPVAGRSPAAARGQ